MIFTLSPADTDATARQRVEQAEQVGLAVDTHHLRRERAGRIAGLHGDDPRMQRLQRRLLAGAQRLEAAADGRAITLMVVLATGAAVSSR